MARGEGRIEEAREILIRYYNSMKGLEEEVVRVEMQDIIAGIEAHKTPFVFNKDGIKSILSSKGHRHRL